MSFKPVKLVGAEGFEPPTYCSQSNRATRLRYAPISFAKAENMFYSISIGNINMSQEMVRHE